jgi:hypothetical protein
MILLEYKTKVELDDKVQAEQAKYICYYQYKENGVASFSMSDISQWFIDFGYNQINVSRLKNNLIKGKNKSFVVSRTNKESLEFIPIQLENLSQELASLWNDTETVESNSELLDESKFCGKRGYLDKLIKQINHTYKNNCYDACAVLLRRVFEIVLVLSFQKNGIESEITKPDGTHMLLDGITKKAIGNSVLRIPKRIADHFDAFREVGNSSAHNITYIAGKKDIDDISRAYRVMLEELYNKAGLL